MADEPTTGGREMGRGLDVLLELADALLEQAEEISRQWAELDRALGDEQPAGPGSASTLRDAGGDNDASN